MVADNLNTEILLELIFCAENKDAEAEIIDSLLHAMLRKLNCFMTGVVKGDGETELQDQQVFPFSFRNDTNWEFVKSFILQSPKNKDKGYCEIELENNYYYVYCLATYGFLIIGRKAPFGNVFKNEFRSVINFYGRVLMQSVENNNRRIAEEKLAEERRLLRTIIDNIPAHIFVKDRNYRKTLANRMEVQRSGLSAEELIGKTDFELFEPELAAEFNVEDSMIIEQGESVLGKERKIGDRWMLVSKIPLRNEEGNVDGLVGISFDYTERKHNQDQLILFKKLFDNISDAVQVSTEDGRLFYINKAGGERLGINPDNIDSIRVVDYIETLNTPQRWSEHVEMLKSTDFLLMEGVNVHQKTGLTFPVEVTVKYVSVSGNGYVVAISRDITERKKVQQALQESEEKYRFMAENASDVLWHLDANYNCDYISSADEALRGYKADEMVGKSLWTILKPEGIEKILQLRTQRLYNEEKGITCDTMHCELEQLCKDGNWIWTEISATPHYDETGKLLGFHGSTRDITKRKKAELARLEIENRYRELVDNSPDGIVIYKNGRVVFVNNEGVRLVGAGSDSDLIGQSVLRFVHPNYRRTIHYQLRSAFDESISVAPVELIVQRMDGAYLEVEVKAMQIIFGNELSVQLIIRDITARKENERKLYASELKYRRITENMSDIVWTSDMCLNLNYISPSVEKMLGESVERHMKRPLEEKFTSDSVEKILTLFAQEMEKEYLPDVDKQRVITIEVEHYKADGSTFWAEINMSILRDEYGTAIGIQGETRDISERRQADLMLQQIRNNYETFFNTIDDFMFVLDESGQIIHTNSTVVNRLGYTEEELKGLSVVMIHPENRRNEAATIVKDMLDGSATYCPVPIMTKSGVHIPVETRVTFGVWDGKPAIFGVTKDISRLQMSEEKFSKSFFMNPSACGFSDVETGQYVEVNNAFYELLGFNAGEVVGKTVTELNIFSEEERLKLLSQADENGSITNVETKLYAKNGDQKQVLLSAEHILIQDKKYRFTVVHDITALKKAENTINQYLDLQKVLINISAKYINLPLNRIEATIQHSLEELADFVGADRAYIFDYDLERNETSNTYEWCAEGISSEKENLQHVSLEFLTEWVERHRQGKEFCVSNVDLLKEQGQTDLHQMLEEQRIKSLITIPMLAKGRLIGFVGFDSVNECHVYTEREKQLLEVFAQMLVNVYDRKSNDTLLRLQEEKYRNIISNMNLGIIEVDIHERIKFANQSFSNMSGYSIDELLEMSTSKLLVSDKYAGILQEKSVLREHGISDNYEIEIQTKQGEHRWWFISGAPNYNDKKELVGSIGIHLDITEQKKLAKELEKAKVSAEYAAKAKEVFLANMSHEIRTPLNVITGMVRELGKGNLNDKQAVYVKHAETATEHLLTIINNILDMSKIESGEFDISNADFSLAAVVADVRSILYSKAQEKKLDFRLTVPAGIAKALIGDSGRLRQIFINLLGNSIKFTESGYVSLAIELLASDKKMQTIRFAIEDSGIGISKEFMMRLFDKFTQEEGETNRRFEGTGLGMSITKELIHLMGGEIQVESQKGMGTKISFEISLPVGDESKLVLKNKHMHVDSFTGMKILLVEDNEMNRFIAVKSLQHVGCDVTEAVNGMDAIDKIKGHHYDLILMDIQMPVLDGVEATKLIRKKYDADIPIIAMTANAFKHDIELYISAGMNDYLIKPYKEKELYEKLSFYFDAATDNATNKELPMTDTLYDLSELQIISRGDNDFINKMLDAFLQISDQTVEQMTDALQAGDYVQINRLAHKIKPSLDNLRIMSLADNIRTLEVIHPELPEFKRMQKLVTETTTVLKQVNQAIIADRNA